MEDVMKVVKGYSLNPVNVEYLKGLGKRLTAKRGEYVSASAALDEIVTEARKAEERNARMLAEIKKAVVNEG